MPSSRREVPKFAGAGLASAAALSRPSPLLAHHQEEAENDPVTIIRKGIDNRCGPHCTAYGAM
jgi:hypothetical protein